ncbi:uncharacterized protein LOC114449768 isoform X3 [Parambassis ranga]|uniref:Uncharacterized protein LOC114449768 isoform X3 n=1 Tax=Parambassis ranga TaxID=210632 RepID=A0A6P7K2G3_9TELE|nr:uncharacterized protein LOC114449768 isoform X3 [Parambassis ranga]
MCISWLGFALLIWLPGLLHVLTLSSVSGQPCPAPKLDDGYVIPQKNSFHHDDSLTYGCDSGLKPAAEGWWATSTCQNGKWSHEPQCISENACLPPTIKNGNITANTKGWYENGSRIEKVLMHAASPLKGTMRPSSAEDTGRCLHTTQKCSTYVKKDIIQTEQTVKALSAAPLEAGTKAQSAENQDMVDLLRRKHTHLLTAVHRLQEEVVIKTTFNINGAHKAEQRNHCCLTTKF